MSVQWFSGVGVLQGSRAPKHGLAKDSVALAKRIAPPDNVINLTLTWIRRGRPTIAEG
jgi:hypothetical protein